MICPNDGLLCSRVVAGMGFGACYVKSLDGKVRSVCPRFFVKSGVSLVEDLVRTELIPK